MGVEKEGDLIFIQNWLKTQQHLPQNIDPILLRRYLHSVHFDLEKCKKLIEISFTMRNNYAHIFLERDPLSKEAQSILHCTDMLPLPYATKENYKVLFYRLVDFDPEKFDFTEAIRAFFMVADVRLVTLDSKGGLSDGEIPIFDMTGYSLRHLARTVLSSLRIYMKYTQEAHPVRLKQIHVINCSSFIDKAMSLVKPFMKSEVFKLIHFHLPNSETLYNHVPKDLLPNEYGGKAGFIKDIKKDIMDSLDKHRDYLMDDTRWKLNPSKREQSKNTNELNGNFKTLSID